MNASGLIILASFLALIASPYLLRRFSRSASDAYGTFAVGARNYGWFRIAAGLSATFVGGAAVINLAGLGYDFGWYGLADVVPTSAALLLSAAFVVPLLWKGRAFSLGGSVQVSGTLVNAATGLLCTVVYTLLTAAQIVALIRVAQPYFPVPAPVLAGVAATGVMAYVLYGGYASVTVTDVIQFLVMTVFYFGLVGLSLLTAGAVGAAAPAAPIPPTALPLDTILLLAAPLLFVPVSQDLHIRVHSSISARAARIGVAIAGVAYLLFGLVSVSVGRALAADGVQLASRDDAVPTFLAAQFGAWAIVPTIAVICVVVSTLDSVLFASASSLAYDFWDRLKAKERTKDTANPRIATVLVLGVALVIALSTPQILGLVLSALVIYVSVLLPMLLGRMLGRRSSALGWVAFAMLGVVVVLEAFQFSLPFRAFAYTFVHLAIVLLLPKETPK